MEINPLSSYTPSPLSSSAAHHSLKSCIGKLVELLKELKNPLLDLHKKEFRNQAAHVILALHASIQTPMKTQNEANQDAALTAQNILSFPVKSHPSLIQAAKNEERETGQTSSLSRLLEEIKSNPLSIDYMSTELALAARDLY